MKNIFKKVTPLAFAVLMLSGCDKEYLDTQPTDSVSADEVFKTTDGAYVALNGIYRFNWEFYNHDRYGQKSWDLVMDLMGNDMVEHTTSYGWYIADYKYTSIKSTTDASRPGGVWFHYYTMIANANNILDKIDGASGSEEDKNNIKGQALAIRANSYFYLVNLWQHTYKGNENAPGVPIYTTSTVEGAPRGTVQDVYDQIISDLTKAEELLGNASPRQVASHIDESVVKGIRARVALQMEDWSTAATKAHEAREGYELMSTNDYQSGFNDVNNDEWMWGLDIINDQSTIYGSFFSHMDTYAGGYAYLGRPKKMTKELYDQIGANDVRKDVIITPGTGTTRRPDYTSVKFYLPAAGSWEGDYVLMRASEMYLIEAEALARQAGRGADAQAVLNELLLARAKDKTAFVPVTATGTDLINRILVERRIELWGEGFSLLDIKRLKQGLNRPTGTGNHNPTIATELTIPAGDNKFLWKIPQKELNTNKAMTAADQNP